MRSLARFVCLSIFFTFYLSLSAQAVESSNKENDAAKRQIGCQTAYRVSSGAMTPGQMTTEQSIAYNYLRSFYPQEFQQCSVKPDSSVRKAPDSLIPIPSEGTFSHAVDAQTIALTTGQKITLLSIKILEGKSSEASAYLNKTLKGHKIRITYDTEPKDRFGKLQGYVFLGEDFINKKLVDEGLAEVNLVSPNTRYEYLLKPRPVSSAEPVLSGDEEFLMKDLQKKQQQMIYTLWGGLFAAVVLGIVLRKWLKS